MQPCRDYILVYRLKLWCWVLIALTISNVEPLHIFKISDAPTHLVQASRFIEPGTPYRVLVTLFQTSRRSPHFNEYVHGSLPATIHVRLLFKGSLLSEEYREAFSDSSTEIALKVSGHVASLQNGDYSVEIEGNHYGGTQGSLFLYERKLFLEQHKAWLWAETNRNVYYFGQSVHFRVFSLDDRGRPWDVPVTIYLWSPHGDEMRRWEGKYPKMGQISLIYDLARSTVSGTWTLEAIVSDQGRGAPTTKVPFQVSDEDPTNAGIFMNIHVKSSVVQAEGRVRGSIESGHVDHPQYPVLGLLRLKLNVTRMRRAFHGTGNSWNPVESRSLLIEGQKSKDGQILNLKPVSWKAQEIQDFQISSPIWFSLPLTSVLRESGFASFPSSVSPSSLSSSLSSSSSPSSLSSSSSSIGSTEEDIFHVRLIGSLIDSWSQENVHHETSFILYPKSFLLGIHLSSCQIYDNFPITLKLWIERANREPLTIGDLDTGNLEVTPTLTLVNGHIVDLNPLIPVYDQLVNDRHWWKTTFSIEELLRASKTELNLTKIHAVTIKALYVTPESKSKAETITLPVVIPSKSKEQISLSSSSRKIRVGDNIIFHVRSRYTWHEIFFLIHCNGKIMVSRRIVGKSSNLITFDERAIQGMAPTSTAVVWSRNKKGQIISSILKLSIKPQGGTEARLLATSNQNNDSFTLMANSKQPSIIITKPSQNGMGTDLASQIASRLSKGDMHVGHLNRNDDIFWLSDTPIPEKPLSSAMSPVCPCRSQCPNHESSNPSTWWIHRNDSPKFENFTESLWQTFETTHNGSKSKTIQFNGLRRHVSLSVSSLSNKGLTSLNAKEFSLGSTFLVSGKFPKRCKMGENVTLDIHIQNVGTIAQELHLTLIATRRFEFPVQNQASRLKNFLVAVQPNGRAYLSVPIVFLATGPTEIRLHRSDNKDGPVIIRTNVLAAKVQSKCWTSLQVELLNRPNVIERLASCAPSESKLVQSKVFISTVVHSNNLHNEFDSLSKEDFCQSNLFALRSELIKNQAQHLKKGSSKPLKERIREKYQQLLCCRNPLGYFSLVPFQSVPSLWLTALATSTLLKLFQEGLAVDGRTLIATLHWLTAHQNMDGSFSESYIYNGFHDHKLPLEFQKMALTAQVLATLADFSTENSQWNVTSVSDVSAMYLKSRLRIVEASAPGNEYELALVAWALTITQSPGAETAFEILAKRKSTNPNGLTFFGPSEQHSSSVRATALAFLVYLHRGELLTEPMALWLNSHRFSADEFSQILSSEAMKAWSDRHPHSPTSLMSFNLKGDNGKERAVHVSRGYAQDIHYPGGVKQLWLEAQGSGRALIVLETVYEPLMEHSPSSLSTYLPIKTDFELANTSSSITVKVCLRWNCHDDKSVSGPIGVLMSLPTGFHIDISNWQFLNGRTGIHVLPQVHDQIYLQLLKLTNEEECFPVTLRSNYNSKGVNKQLVISVQDQFSRELSTTTYLQLPNLSHSNHLQGCEDSVCFSASGAMCAKIFMDHYIMWPIHAALAIMLRNAV